MNITQAEIRRLQEVVSDPDILYEDYAFSLYDLHNQGIESVQCDVWCAECEEEYEVEVDTESFEWTCPNCGAVDNQ